MNRHTIGDLYQMQSLPLEAKMQMTERRIREWVDYYGQDGVYVSFSGGKDSVLLLHLVRRLYPDIPAVFVDTGLEYPEVREFVRSFGNVDILKPKMDFRQSIVEYGYPFISKEVADCVYGARRYLAKLAERERMGGNGIVANYSYMADLAGIDRRIDRGNEAYRNLAYGKISSEQLRAPARYLMLQGKYIHKEGGVETAEYSRMYNKERYKFFLDAPFEISAKCCDIMKKAPLHRYARQTGRMPMTAQMASESRLRATKWLQNGCNGFHMKSPISNPMSFWTEQDVLQYIYENGIPLAGVYGEVKETLSGDCGRTGRKASARAGLFDLEKPVYETTGTNRTGCVYCGFGCHMDKPPNRWEIAEKISNPAVIDYMLRGGAFDGDGIWKPDRRGLGFWFVIEWINVHGGLHIAMPHRERYLGQCQTAETEKYLKMQTA